MTLMSNCCDYTVSISYNISNQLYGRCPKCHEMAELIDDESDEYLDIDTKPIPSLMDLM